MKILVLAVAFAPEITALAPYNTDLCTHLARRGHSVSAVVGFPHYPQWRKAKQYAGKWYAEERYEGVRLIRVPQYIPREPTSLRRIAYDTSFSLSALTASLTKVPRPDLIVAMCSPLQLGVVGATLSRRWRAPLIFHVQDLLPEGAIALGMLTDHRVIAIANRMADYSYRHAAMVTAIGPGMVDALLKRGVPSTKVRYLPNWVDTRWIYPAPRMSPWRRRIGVDEDTFLILYVGNLGYKQQMSVAVEAARLLRHRRDLAFVIVGDGPERPRIAELINRYRLKNIQLLGVQPREDLNPMLAASDLHLLHQRKEVVDMVAPSKLLTYSASGRPILFAGVTESEGARFVVAGKCGVIITPEDPGQIAQSIMELQADPAARLRMGQNARSYVEAHFTRDRILAFTDTILEEAHTTR